VEGHRGRIRGIGCFILSEFLDGLLWRIRASEKKNDERRWGFRSADITRFAEESNSRKVGVYVSDPWFSIAGH